MNELTDLEYGKERKIQDGIKILAQGDKHKNGRLCIFVRALIQIKIHHLPIM